MELFGYNNGAYVLNDICKQLYSNQSLGIKARSINLKDFENCMTEKGKSVRDAFANEVQYGKEKIYTESNSYEPNGYIVQGKDGDESSDLYTTPTTETYQKAEGESLTVKQTFYYMPINQDNYGVASNVLYDSNWYWLASRYVSTGSSNVRFGLRYAGTYINCGYMFYSDSNNSSRYSRCIRPVVSLGSKIQIDMSSGDGTQSKPYTLNMSSIVKSSYKGESTNGDVTITASAEDKESGIDYYEYSTSNTATTGIKMEESTLTISDEGENTYYVRAVDKAGNKGALDLSSIYSINNVAKFTTARCWFCR